MVRPIRLVTFDALHTIVVPRLPIHVQYSHVFEPFLGNLQPGAVKRAFKVAFAKQSIYTKGSYTWWTEVIKKTALEAGADERALSATLEDIVPLLMTRFSSKEGYRAYEDSLPALRFLHNDLNLGTAVISNADSRIRLVLKDLGFPTTLNPVILSEEEGVEKPSPEIFLRALSRVNSALDGQSRIEPEECLHVGDELESDYNGAIAAGMQALLLRRSGEDAEPAHRDADKITESVQVVEDLHQVAVWVRNYNKRTGS